MPRISGKHVVLERQEIEKLNKFVGFGDFSENDVLFFGIEEGLGPKQLVSVQEKHLAEAVLRLDYFGKNPEYCQNGKNCVDGYSVKGIETDNLREECYKDLRLNYVPPKSSSGNYVNYASRMLLALGEENSQETDEAIDKWFVDMSVDSPTVKIIRHRMAVGVDSAYLGRKASLTDWHPLPRQNIDGGIFIGDFDEKEFINTFDFKTSDDDFSVKMRNARLGIYKNIFNRRHIPIVIGIGAKGDMIKLYTNIFGELKDEFPKFYYSKLPEKIGLFWAKIDFGEKSTFVVCINHFRRMSLAQLKGITLKIRKLQRGQHDSGDVEQEIKTFTRRRQAKEKSLKHLTLTDSDNQPMLLDETIAKKTKLAELTKRELCGPLLYVNGRVSNIRFLSKKIQLRDSLGGRVMGIGSGHLLVFECIIKRDCILKLLLSEGEKENREKVFRALATAGMPFQSGIREKNTGTITLYKIRLWDKNQFEIMDLETLENIVKKKLNSFVKDDLPLIEGRLGSLR